jgi:glutamate N-acetyltransferase/amino-acid N-acetyltransferase
MRASQIKIAINLNSGEGKATAWGSDFSYEYVRINAEYTT